MTAAPARRTRAAEVGAAAGAAVRGDHAADRRRTPAGQLHCATARAAAAAAQPLLAWHAGGAGDVDGAVDDAAVGDLQMPRAVRSFSRPPVCAVCSITNEIYRGA